MLNTKEAARFLRVSQASIRRWADSGRLAASRVGGRRERRFKESDLLAFLDAETESKRTPTSVTFGAAAVPVPGHVAAYYTSDDGGLRLTVPFLADGLRLGQPCLVVATGTLAARYQAALSGRSPGRITFIVFEHDTAAGVIAEWEQRFSAMVADGAQVIRVVGEMSCEREMFDSEEEMLRYEEAFELLSKRYPVTVVCQYDARVVSGLTIVRSFKAHPDNFQFRVGTFLN